MTNEYAKHAPLFAELATLSEDDPERGRLRDELVTEHMPLAEHIAARFRHRGVAEDDLRQVAMLGLVNAVDRFQPERGSDFLSFAVPTIMGEVRRYFRDAAWPMRVPRRLKELHLSIGKAIDELAQRTGRAPRPAEIAEHLGLAVDEVRNGLEAGYAYRTKSISAESDEDAEPPAIVDQLGEVDNQLEEAESREVLAPLLAELPDRERLVLWLRFFENQTQSEIARRIGISQMHVSRLLSRTLSELRELLEK